MPKQVEPTFGAWPLSDKPTIRQLSISVKNVAGQT